MSFDKNPKWLPPGYLAMAWECATPSLKQVVSTWSKEAADQFVYAAGMTKGTRCLLASKALLHHLDPNWVDPIEEK